MVLQSAVRGFSSFTLCFFLASPWKSKPVRTQRGESRMAAKRNRLSGSQRKFRNGLLSAAVLLAAGLQSAEAATFTWISTTTANNAWGTTTNWQGGLNTPAAGDTVNIQSNITAAMAITMAADETMGTLNIGDSTGGPLFSAFTIGANGGNKLIFDNTINSTNSQINKPLTTVTAADVIAAPVVIGTATSTVGLTITNSSGSLL